MGAVDLGERWLLLMLGALAVPERADVGGESRLLLGRVVAVLQEHGRLKLAPLLLQQVSLRVYLVPSVTPCCGPVTALRFKVK